MPGTRRLESGILKMGGALAALGGLAWLGLKVPPEPFAPPSEAGRDLGHVKLPDELPNPARRHFQAVALLPRVESALASGRGRFALAERPLKVWAPMRWRAYVEPGRQFRWEAELTWFGRPFIAGNDEIIGGQARSMMGGHARTGEAIRKSEHTVLWLYTLAFCPSALFTLPEVEWKAVDDDVTARLLFPYQDKEWCFNLHFDPASSALARVTTQRFHGSTGELCAYQVTFAERRSLGGTSLFSLISAAWGDDFYIHLTPEHARYNVALPFAPENPPAESA
jgi:hypothetical protein